MVIQIYDQISTLRVWSKVKLRRSISLRFGLKEGKMALRNWKQMQPFRDWFHQVCLSCKIARNPLKFCIHVYLSNGYLNSLSSFNYKKTEKITSLRPFTYKKAEKIASHSISLRFGLKEGKMALRNWKQIQPFRASFTKFE